MAAAATTKLTFRVIAGGRESGEVAVGGSRRLLRGSAHPDPFIGNVPI